MRDDLHRRIGFASGAQFGAGEALMHLAGAFPGDDFYIRLRGHVFREILIRQKDHGRRVEALYHLQRVGRGAADVHLRLHVGRCIDIGHDRHAGETLAQQPHVGAGDARSQRAAGALVRDQDRLVRIEDLRGLRHEVHAALNDDVGLYFRGLDRELQRVAADVGDAMENLRRLVVVRQDHRAAHSLQFVDRLDGGRHQRPFDRRDHASDALIEMRGGAFDILGPFELRPRQRRARDGD